MADEFSTENLLDTLDDQNENYQKEALLTPDPIEQYNQEQKVGTEFENQGQEQQLNPLENVIYEAGAALTGGAADAVDSVGGFLDLSGDTVKQGINSLLRKPTEDSQNVFHADYEHGAWWDIPDDEIPENKTGMGKFARGLVEFGFLTAATGGVGGKVLGGARLTTRIAASARVAGIGTKGVRTIKFISKGARIAGEGGVAELMSGASEEGNLMNLAQEHTPWMVPWIANALAISPEDNPWLARIKTVTTGSGINLLGWGISAFAKGRWAAMQDYRVSKDVERANALGNAKFKAEMDEALASARANAEKTAAERFEDGKGVPHTSNRDEYLRTYLSEEEYLRYTDPENRVNGISDDLEFQADERGYTAGDPFDFETNISAKQRDAGIANRTEDSLVNPNNRGDSEKAFISVEPNATKKAVTRAVTDKKTGGVGKSYTNTITESALKRAAKNSPRRYAIIQQQAKELSQELFNAPGNKKNFEEIKGIVDGYIERGLEIIEEGGNIAERFKKLYKNDPKNKRVYIDDGTTIVTISPAQKAAIQVQLGMLADTITGVAQGAINIADNVAIETQMEMLTDALRVLLREHKMVGAMWGLDGKAQQINKLPKLAKEVAESKIRKIDDELDSYFSSLDNFRKSGDYQGMKNFMELHALSGGKIHVMEQVNDFINAKLFGGSMNGKKIKGRVWQQVMSTFYNSILSSVRTPIKAIFGTNLIALTRPYISYAGAFLRQDATEMAVAASMMDAIGKGWGESMDMFRHNMDLGMQRKTQSYDVRYSTAEDIAEWKRMASIIEEFGTNGQKRAYGVLDAMVQFNTSPWVKFSTNSMGAGDAFARTIIGRMEMRHRATRRALSEGVGLEDLNRYARKNEESFRDQIFKKDEYDKWIVSDEGARMAGDEAAMTKALEGGMASFGNLIDDTPLLRPFFPFIKTGVNALDLTFQHTPLIYTRKKFRDILEGKNLDVYGIKPENAKQAAALIEGRMATGSAIMTMSFLAALQGNMTGDYPYDKTRRELWQKNKIPPYSFKIGNAWVSYKDIEPFNTLFAMSGNLVQNADVLGEGYLDDMVPKLMFMTSAVLVDKSMLSGVKDLAAVFNPESADYQLQTTLARQIRGFIPFSGLSRDIGNILDSVEKEYATLGEQIIRRDAFMKSVLNPKYDILSKDRSGKEFTRTGEFDGPGGFFLSPMLRIFNTLSPIPIVPVDAPDDHVRKILMDMKYDMPDILRSYKGERLNSKERSRLQYYLSTGSLRADLERLLGDGNRIETQLNQYKKGYGPFNKFTRLKGDDIKHQEFYRDVHKIFQRAKEQAMQQVLLENPELGRRIDLRGRKKNLAKSGRYDRVNELLSLPK